MRHGPAEDQAASGRDFDRQLTPSGRTRTELVAKQLALMDQIPMRIVSSPLARTIETSQVVIATLGLALEIDVREELAPGGHAIGLLRQMASEGAKRTMFVGHEPDVSALTAHLFPTWSRGFDKGMVVGLKIERGALINRARTASVATLRFVIEPKKLGN